MIFSVTTLLDDPAEIQRFVERNLASGVDHMLVFLDGEQPEASALLAGNPFVTVAVTNDAYWGAGRPAGLNTRQTINANLARVLLWPFDWAEWLFHIDGDECLDIDRERLLALDRDVRSVSLSVLEVVSTPEGRTDRFKHRLPPDDLELLQVLGLLRKPENWNLFNGYHHGKVGIRPSLDYSLHIHAARTHDGEPVASYEADFLRILHYDSVTPEAFIRKWTSHAQAEHRGGTVFGAKRTRIRAAVASVLDNPHLDAAQRDHYLREIYARTAQDDVETLETLGFLVTPPPAWHAHEPERLDPVQADSMRRLMDFLVRADKASFRPRVSQKDPRRLLKRASRTVLSSDPRLSHLIASGLADEQAPARAWMRR